MDEKKIKLGEEFKPSPKWKWRCYLNILLTLAIFGIIIGAFIFIGSIFIGGILTIACLPLFVIGIILTIVWVELYYASIVYKLTETEIFWSRGVLSKMTGIVPYNRITNIDIVQSPISRILGIADLIVQTAGYSGYSGYSGRFSAEMKIEGIENFEELRDIIMDFVRKKGPVSVETYDKGETTGTGGTTTPAMSKGAGSEMDRAVLDELTKIRKLLEKRKR